MEICKKQCTTEPSAELCCPDPVNPTPTWSSFKQLGRPPINILCGESGTTVLITPETNPSKSRPAQHIQLGLLALETLTPTWDVHRRVLTHAWHRLVVVGATDLQALALEVDTVECHSLGSLIYRAELKHSTEDKEYFSFLSSYWHVRY